MADERQAYFESTVGKTGELSLVVKEGSPAEEIAKRAQELDANLVVMGVHNQHGINRILGSTTQKVLNQSGCDVLAIHPDSSGFPYQRVLVAVDTTEHAQSVLSRAMIVADAASVKKVVSVVVPLQSVFLAPTDAQRVNWSFDELHADIVEQTQSKVQRFIRES